MKFVTFSSNAYRQKPPSKFGWLGGILFCLSWSATATEHPHPTWEFGLGLGALHIPHYRGSNDSRTYIMPYPYFIYRGERLNMDERGITGWLFKSENIKLNISLAAGVPVPSSADSVRAGMPELDPTIEIGPVLQIKLWQHATEYQSFWLTFPIRSAYSIDSLNIKHQGWVFSPSAIFNITRFGSNHWHSNLIVGPLYADANYHDYFYGVADQYSTPNRQPYQAKAGYAGMRTSISLINRNKKRMISLYWRMDSLKKAVFLPSNLVKRDDYQIIGLSYTWFLGKSSTITKTQ